MFVNILASKIYLWLAFYMHSYAKKEISWSFLLQFKRSS